MEKLEKISPSESTMHELHPSSSNAKSPIFYIARQGEFLHSEALCDIPIFPFPREKILWGFLCWNFW